MTTLQSPRSTVVRGSQRADYDRDTLYPILDAGLICHVAAVVDGEPRILPTAYTRVDDAIVLHGNLHNGVLKALLSEGQLACINVSLVDGLVLARSGMHNSMNYRSATVYGRAELVAEAEEKVRLLSALLDHQVKGNSRYVRPFLAKELAATLVIKVPIKEGSAKVRNGPPVDAEADYALDLWAGVIPLQVGVCNPERCPRAPAELGIPSHIADFLAD